MPVESLASILLKGRYWILVPLSMLEGPTVAFVTGALVARGYFNIFAAYGIFFAKDLIVDGGYYYLGRFFSRRPLVARLLTRSGVTGEELERARGLWDRHGWRAMTVGKLSWGLSPAFLTVAGMVAVPIASFFTYAAGVALVQYAVLLTLGYYVGQVAAVSGAIRGLQYAAAALVVIAIVWLRRRLRP